MESTHPSSSRPAPPGESAGAAAGRRLVPLPERYPVAEWCVRRGIETATGASSQCAGRAEKISTPGWSPKGGRWHTDGTPERTSPRRLRHERRGEGSGGANSSRPGSGGARRANGPPRRSEADAASRETSTARASGSTTSPAASTTNAPGSRPRRESGGSVPNARPGQRDGGKLGDNPNPVFVPFVSSARSLSRTGPILNRTIPGQRNHSIARR